MGLFTIDRTINFDEKKVKKILSFIRDSKNDEEIENKMISSNVVSLRDNTSPHGFFRRRWGTFLREFGVYTDDKISEIGELYLNELLSTKELILLNLINRYSKLEKSEKTIRPFESLIRISEYLYDINKTAIINEEELRYINENLVDNSEESLKKIVTEIIEARNGNIKLNLELSTPVHYDIWKNLLKTAGVSLNSNQIEIDVNLPIVRYISKFYRSVEMDDKIDSTFNDYIPLPIKCDENQSILYKRKSYEQYYSRIIYKYLFEKSINNIESEELLAKENGNIPYNILNGFNISTSRQDNPSNMRLYNAFIGYEGIIINRLRKTNDAVYSFIASNIKAYIDENFYKTEDNEEKLRDFYIENLKNNSYVEEIRIQREKFISEYPLERILTLTIEEYCLGLEGFKDSFCNKLEKGEYSDTGFGIGGANASKFGIYFKRDKKFHGKNDILIENPKEYWEKYKKQLYNFLLEMGNKEPNFSIAEKYDLLGGSGGFMYLTKLLCLYYPDRFIAMSKPEAYEKLNTYLKIENQDNAVKNSYYANIAFRNYAPESKENFGFYISNAIWKFFKMDEEKKTEGDDGGMIDELERETGGFNKIYYGVPGCGKSYTVNKEFDKDTYKIERTTFHPEYTNSDFVGQIIPKLIGSAVSYEFHPGAFAKTLLYALTHPTEKVCLIIEEINRGNASAIFGDIFQLLDRDDKGKSRYSIFNGQLIDYLKNNKIELKEIYIPSNMWIVATMNTSDQNVFTLDTAFKRRWKMEYIKNVFGLDAESQKLKNTKIPFDGKYNNITWGDFVTKINKHILLDKSGVNSEDKQLGMYFVSIEEINNKKEFAEKILSYIWEDVAKLNPEYWFGDIDSYDELLQKYDEIYLKVFDTLFEEEITIIEDINIENAETPKGE